MCTASKLSTCEELCSVTIVLSCFKELDLVLERPMIPCVWGAFACCTLLGGYDCMCPLSHNNLLMVAG